MDKKPPDEGDGFVTPPTAVGGGAKQQQAAGPSGAMSGAPVIVLVGDAADRVKDTQWRN